MTGIAACVVHYGDPRPARDVVSDLAEQVRPPNAVVVVDNGPGEAIDLAGVAWDGPLAVLRSGRNRGYAGAVNDAAAWARAAGLAQLWVLNNDVSLDAAALAELEWALAVEPDADVAGSVVTAGDTVWFGGGRYSPRWGRASHEGFGDDAGARWDGAVVGTDWVNGCSILIRLASLERRGPFDEHLFLYREELDWQVRPPPARAVLVRRPLVDHAVGLTTGSTDGRLGRLFLARNGWLLAGRQPLARRARWRAAWVAEFLLLPLARGRWREIRWALDGVRLRRASGPEIVGDL